ncbi:MAG: hypothetical protein IJV82_04105 [Oscillospiraceae bacterium]|nr:hypothetical protein [Oscillospiraceae bacterium]
MGKIRNRFERFCFRNRNKGIPNLMLYLSLGAGLVYLMSYFAQNYVLYYYLCFNKTLILQGQVWRLFTYPLTYGIGQPHMMLVAISLLCYYSLGRAMENLWGTFRFNLYYLSGMLMMDIYCMIFGGMADVNYLNLSLFLGYATLYPHAQFLLLFIIPVKAWIFAVLDLVLVVYGLVAYPFPANLFSVISLANYFLFFGKDVLNLIPLSWRGNGSRLGRKKKKSGTAKTIPFPSAGSCQASTASVKAPYTHRCTVCGRTDVSNPELEFRYCSRCNGYYCYCQEHISNHVHIQ